MNEVIFPENSKYFVAIGAAMNASKSEEISVCRESFTGAEHADPAKLSDTKHTGSALCRRRRHTKRSAHDT